MALGGRNASATSAESLQSKGGGAKQASDTCAVAPHACAGTDSWCPNATAIRAEQSKMPNLARLDLSNNRLQGALAGWLAGWLAGGPWPLKKLFEAGTARLSSSASGHSACMCMCGVQAARLLTTGSAASSLLAALPPSCRPSAPPLAGPLPQMWGYLWPNLQTLILNSNSLYVTSPTLGEAS